MRAVIAVIPSKGGEETRRGDDASGFLQPTSTG